ncbi:hypothetical protein BDV18DRAFT_130007 [Aspergillus unguis]
MAPSTSKPGSPAPPSPTPIDKSGPDYSDPSFDPVSFLNESLPPLSLQSQSQLQAQSQSQSQGQRPVTLAELSTRVQSILSQTNAQNIRHSTTLTSQTDEILRSGNRLAYEVEVLRGEAITLSELVTEGLAGEIARFTTKTKAEATEDEEEDAKQTPKEVKKAEPEYITNLRTLNQVRARLEEVVQTFGDAMKWPLPPSETSITSSFISVSAPEVGSEGHSREEKGQEVASKLRAEIADLLNGEGGIEAATQRVEALRVLAMVWKGTAEEKARGKFVEGLLKTVDERRRAVEAAAAPGKSSNQQGSRHQRQESEGPGGGIFKNLQRLREEIYLE